MFGSRTGGTATDGFGVWVNAAGAINRSDYNVSASQNYNTQMARTVLDRNRNLLYINGSLIYTHPISTFSGVNMYLFNYNTNDTSVQNGVVPMTVYNMKIWVNDVLVRDFVPVPVGSTRFSGFPAPSNCMWDKVTRAYFQNAGTGSFGIVEVDNEIQSIIQQLIDLPDLTGKPTQIYTVGSYYLSQLTPAQIAIGQLKNWTII